MNGRTFVSISSAFSCPSFIMKLTMWSIWFHRGARQTGEQRLRGSSDNVRLSKYSLNDTKIVDIINIDLGGKPCFHSELQQSATVTRSHITQTHTHARTCRTSCQRKDNSSIYNGGVVALILRGSGEERLKFRRYESLTIFSCLRCCSGG